MKQFLKSNLGCGVFVLFIIAIALYMVVLLSGVQEAAKPKRAFQIAFDLKTGALGLKADSAVRVGGQVAGRVTDVKYDDTSKPERWIVHVAVYTTIKLAKDAVVNLDTPLLGTVSALNFSSVGDLAKSGEAPEGFLFVGSAAPGLLAQAGVNKEDIEALIKNARDLTATANHAVEKVNTKLDPILANVEDATANAKGMTGDLREGAKRWVPKIDRTMDNVVSASGALDERLVEAKALIAAVQGVIDANRPRIDAIAEHLREIMARVNGETLPQITRILNQGERGVTAAADTLENLREFVREEEPGLRLTLANLRLASDQLKLTLAEVRRNPWRLFYQPGAKELEREMLFEAARAYSESVGELRAATASLEKVSIASRAGGPDAPTQARVNELLESLKASYARYKANEDEFLRRLLTVPPAQ